MKKLLILVALVTVVATALVACKDDSKTPAETTGSDVVTSAPEESSSAPEESSSTPEESSSAPEESSSAPEESSSEPEESSTTNTPEVELPYIDKILAAVLQWSFDSFKVNGVAIAGNGDYVSKMEAINSTVEIPAGFPENTVTFDGWIGFEREIDRYGYIIDNAEIVYGDFDAETESAVKDHGGEYATRFVIDVPIGSLSVGKHTVTAVVKLDNGTVAEIWTATLVLGEVTDWENDKEDVKHVSFDGVSLDGGENIKPADKTTPVTIGQEISTLQIAGWAGFASENYEYAYIMDDGCVVVDPSFIVAADQSIVDEAAGLGAAHASKFRIAIDVADLRGVHNVKVLVKTAGKYVIIAEFTVDKVFDENAPICFLDAEKLAQPVAGTSHDLTAVVTDNYITYTPTGKDPYYYPVMNTKGAQFLAIKYRTTTTPANIQIYICSDGSAGPANDVPMMEAAAITDGEWHLMIFNLAENRTYDGKTVSYFRFDVLEPGYLLDENGQPYREANGDFARHPLPDGATLDVEYVSFFSSEEAANKYYEGN